MNLQRLFPVRIVLMGIVFAIVMIIAIAWWSAWRVDVWPHTSEKADAVFVTVNEQSPHIWCSAVFGRRTGCGVLTYSWPTYYYISFRRIDAADVKPEWTRRPVPPVLSDEVPKTSMWFEEARGWPLLCLRSEHTLGKPASNLQAGFRLSSTQGAQNLPRALPLIPIWPGLLGNVLIYFIAFMLPATCFLKLRERRRLQRSCCPRCAYPFGNSPRCAECGEMRAKGTTG